jgi:hypothetical protein
MVCAKDPEAVLAAALRLCECRQIKGADRQTGEDVASRHCWHQVGPPKGQGLFARRL